MTFRSFFQACFRALALAGIAAGIAAGAPVARAAEPASKPAMVKPGDDDWIVMVGGTAIYGPRHPGAERMGFSGMPSLGFRRANEPAEFAAPEDGLDYTLFGTPHFKIGPVANLRGGRSTAVNPRFAGLDNYPWRIEAGVFAEFWPDPEKFRTRVELRHGVRGHDGFVADFSADFVQKFGAFTLSGGPRLSVTDRNVTEIEYGVSAMASARNGYLPAYKAHGGVSSVGLGIALGYDVSEQWRTVIFHRYDRMLGSAAQSPITRRLGAPDQFTFGLSLAYSFRVASPLK